MTKWIDQIMNNPSIMQQLELMWRIVLAAMCGGLIGYERESRKKTAGLRTHVIVAISSALMIVLSKYGFNDVLGEYVKLDPSRIAAGTVTAIGFLGSGVIYARKRDVSGVTTSAGIWATLGVGMAVGAGMYVIGITTTLMILAVEIFLGRGGKASYIIKEVHQVQLVYTHSDKDEEIIEQIKNELETQASAKILKFQMKRDDDTIRVDMLIRAKRKSIHLMKLAEEYPEIIKISV